MIGLGVSTYVGPVGVKVLPQASVTIGNMPEVGTVASATHSTVFAPDIAEIVKSATLTVTIPVAGDKHSQPLTSVTLAIIV